MKIGDKITATVPNVQHLFGSDRGKTLRGIITKINKKTYAVRIESDSGATIRILVPREESKT